MKTAISLQQDLFKQVDELARELEVSRSRLFVLAVEQFIERHRNRKLLAAINDAYDDVPDSKEQALHESMRRQHRHLVEGQW